MPKQIFFKPWHGHLLHLTVLACVFLYGWKQLVCQNQIADLLTASCEPALNFVKNEKVAAAFQGIYTFEIYDEKAQTTIRMAAKGKTLLDSLLARQSTAGPLEDYILQLADSLRQACHLDSTACQHIAACLSQPDMALLISNLQTAVKENYRYPDKVADALASHIHLRVLLASNAVLRYLDWLTEPVTTYPSPRIKPVVVPDSPPPCSGQVYTAHIYPILYLPFEKNMTLKVNGREYPVEKGIAHYKRVFSKPGRYFLNVEIMTPPPLVPRYKAGRIQTEQRRYDRTFTVQIW